MLTQGAVSAIMLIATAVFAVLMVVAVRDKLGDDLVTSER